MPYYIAFDLSHKPRGKIDENYTELRDHLNSNGFVCYNLLETPITQISLRPFDILVFICPDFAKISSQEINEIQNWVKEDGGGLLMLSHAGGDKGRNSNLGDLSQQFGINFENDQVLDEVNNIGMENMPIISSENFKPPHPITDNIEIICYRAGCSLTVIGNAISIISSNESSEPFFTPLLCTAEPDKGRICAIGSYEMFRDKTGGGFQYDNHADLALNIFNWLVTDYRMELRSEEGKAAPTPEEGQTEGEEENSCVSPVYNAPETQPVEYKEVEGLKDLKISSKAELIELLNFFLTQLNTVKFTVENLIKAVQENKGDLFPFSTDETSLETTDYERYTYDKDQYNDYSEETYQNEQYSYDYASEEHPNSFTSLPPKPFRYEKSESESKNQEDVSEVSQETELEDLTNQQEFDETESEALLSELEGLQSKVNSVHNLINFIEKKHDSGKLDDKSYKKQIKKLNHDLEKTESRINELKKLLDN